MKKILTILMAITLFLHVANNLKATTIDTYASTDCGIGPGPWYQSSLASSGRITSQINCGGYGYSEADDSGKLVNEIIGMQNVNYLSAQYTYSSFETNVTNFYNVSKQLIYKFLINSTLSVTDFYTDHWNGRSGYTVTVEANGKVVWNSSATLNTVLNTGAPPGQEMGTELIVLGQDLGIYNNGPDYTVSNFLGLLPLGVLAPGDTLTLKTTISLKGVGIEQANYYDYGFMSLSGSLNFASVPEPATMLLFGTGIAGLAAFDRRKKAH